MACTEEEFLDLLGGEAVIDLGKLVDASRHGIPPEVRGEVWKYLLEVAKPDKSEEERQKKQQTLEYQELLGDVAIHAEFTRDCRNALKSAPVLFGGVCLLMPLVSALRTEADIYHCYAALIRRIHTQLPKRNIPGIVLRFMMYFRTIVPSLYHHFEEEEVSLNDWAMSWFQYLLAAELPLTCLLRLWDTYLAGDLGLGLHTYVCLAILVHCAEELLELENSEILYQLHHLPVMDMDKIIAQAYNIRDEIRANNEL